jgi:hypothetical protein
MDEALATLFRILIGVSLAVYMALAAAFRPWALAVGVISYGPLMFLAASLAG